MTRLSYKIVGAVIGMSSAIAGSTAAFAVDVPTTAPAPLNQAAAPVRQAPRVEVFPFTSVSGPTTGQDWNGRGIQENLQSDVSRTGATLTLAPHVLAATDDPIAIARQNHADLAVTGTYQMVGDQIRANGQLIDVQTNTPVGGFSATGTQHDLFKIEDALGEQLRGLLPRPETVAQLQQATEQPQSPQTIVYEQPATVYSTPPQPVYNNYYTTTPAPAYYYPDYSYPYDYGYYGGFGFFPGFVSVNFGRDHDRDGGRDRDGFHDHGFVGGVRGGATFGNGGFRGNAGGVGRNSVGTIGGFGGNIGAGGGRTGVGRTGGGRTGGAGGVRGGGGFGISRGGMAGGGGRR